MKKSFVWIVFLATSATHISTMCIADVALLARPSSATDSEVAALTHCSLKTTTRAPSPAQFAQRLRTASLTEADQMRKALQIASGHAGNRVGELRKALAADLTPGQRQQLEQQLAKAQKRNQQYRWVAEREKLKAQAAATRKSLASIQAHESRIPKAEEIRVNKIMRLEAMINRLGDRIGQR
jgi:hypothetical protein